MLLKKRKEYNLFGVIVSQSYCRELYIYKVTLYKQEENENLGVTPEKLNTEIRKLQIRQPYT